MSAADTAAGLAAFPGRGAGTDAERRAAHWLARQVRSPGRAVRLETFWCRPNWALAHAWHCLLAVVGSLLLVHHAIVGGVILLIALSCAVVPLMARSDDHLLPSPAPTPKELGMHSAFLVAAALDTGRALALISRAPHRGTRSGTAATASS